MNSLGKTTPNGHWAWHLGFSVNISAYFQVRCPWFCFTTELMCLSVVKESAEVDEQRK